MSRLAKYFLKKELTYLLKAVSRFVPYHEAIKDMRGSAHMKSAPCFFKSGTGNLLNRHLKPGGSLSEGHQDYRVEETDLRSNVEGTRI